MLSCYLTHCSIISLKACRYDFCLCQQIYSDKNTSILSTLKAEVQGPCAVQYHKLLVWYLRIWSCLKSLKVMLSFNHETRYVFDRYVTCTLLLSPPAIADKSTIFNTTTFQTTSHLLSMFELYYECQLTLFTVLR